MNNALLEIANATPANAAASCRGEETLTIEQLARAVAENALLNTEVDQKIATRVLETKEELKATQHTVAVLRQQIEQLVQNFGQVLEITRLEWQQQLKSSSGATANTPAGILLRLLSPQRFLAMGANLRLNIGCGLIPLPAYFNIDVRELPGVDMIADVHCIPMRPSTVSEIYAAHLVEHFTEEDLKTSVLPSWHRMLKPGGLLRIVVPDAEAMIQSYSRGQYPFNYLRRVTFGGQDYPGNFHYTMFSRESLRDLLRTSGFLVGEYTALARQNDICLEMELQARKGA